MIPDGEQQIFDQISTLHEKREAAHCWAHPTEILPVVCMFFSSIILRPCIQKHQPVTPVQSHPQLPTLWHAGSC
jgi:hypothetical protein